MNEETYEGLEETSVEENQFDPEKYKEAELEILEKSVVDPKEISVTSIDEDERNLIVQKFKELEGRIKYLENKITVIENRIKRKKKKPNGLS